MSEPCRVSPYICSWIWRTLTHFHQNRRLFTTSTRQHDPEASVIRWTRANSYVFSRDWMSRGWWWPHVNVTDWYPTRREPDFTNVWHWWVYLRQQTHYASKSAWYQEYVSDNWHTDDDYTEMSQTSIQHDLEHIPDMKHCMRLIRLVGKTEVQVLSS